MKISALSITAKITLIALSFILPISVLVYLMVSGINANINVARLEQTGDAYLRPLVDTMERLQDYQHAAASCTHARTGCATVLGPLRDRADASLRNLEEADARYGTALKFTVAELSQRGRSEQTAANVVRKWNAIAAAEGSASPEQYTQLVADLRTMITHAGDTSNLILDPDLDTYYLMDVVLIALPQTQDRIAIVASETSRLLVEGSETGRIRAAVSASQLAEDRKRVSESSHTALNEDPHFYGASPSLSAALPPALVQYEKVAQQFENLTQKISQPGSKVDQQEYEQASAEARKAAYGYWRVAVTELDRLLEARARYYQDSRTTSLMWSGLALLIAAALAFYFARSITVPLRNLMRSLGPGATLLGECVNRISAVSQEQTVDPMEAKIICGELDAHADSMRQAVLALARQVSGSTADSFMEQPMVGQE